MAKSARSVKEKKNNKGGRNFGEGILTEEEQAAEEAQEAPQQPPKEEPPEELHIADLKRMKIHELHELAESEGVPNVTGLKKQELIYKILESRVKRNG